MSNKSHLFINECFLFGLLFVALPAVNAQITPDNTLGVDASQVTPNILINGANADRIDGGAIRNINLFHSFSEFNIKDGQRVYFANPSGVFNILTRVTGKDASSIFGTLGVDGNANLFLMNPNGILFGKNASLDVRGSFVGTTANGLKFGNQGVFSTTNPEAPALLTINPNALVFSQQQSGAITNQSQAPAGVNPDGNPATGLRVPDGKSLLFVGGNINSDGGRFRAYDGRVELTGLAAPGNIGLDLNGDTIRTIFPDNLNFADIFLGNVSAISVFGDKGGEITINARNIGIDNSYLFAGITGKESPNTQVGDITLNATENITLTGYGSGIDNSVYGTGNGGNVFVRANGAVILDGAFVSSSVESSGVGNGGDINLEAGSLNVKNSGQFLTVVRGAKDNLPGGRGNGGDVNVKVRGAVTFANPLPGIANGILTDVETEAVGNAGNVTVNAGSLDVTGGSEIQTSTRGIGNAGNITIDARDIRFNGRDGNQGSFSRAIASVQKGAEGNGGNINITTENLQLSNGAFISNNIYGTGNAGNISITARDINLDTWSKVNSDVTPEGVGNGGKIGINTNTLFLTNGSFISSSILGQGNAGNIIIDAKDSIGIDGVLVDGNQLFGISPDLFITSSIGNDLLNGSIGKAGDISISTPFLSLTNGGEVTSRSGGQGNAGNITINARDKVIIDGFKGENFLNSQVSNAVTENGNGGNIRINTGDLVVKNGGKINAINVGIGNAGNIFLDVRDTITFDGSTTNLPSGASTFSTNGNAGNLEINTGSLFLTNGGDISSNLFRGRGNGGDITINARDTVKIDGAAKGLISPDGSLRDSNSVISSALIRGEGKGGDITINTGSLSVTNGGNITASASGKGNAGNITIDARDIVTFDGGGKNILGQATTFASGSGSGGSIQLKTGTLLLRNGGYLSSNAETNSGNITIEARDAVIINGGESNNILNGIFSTLSSGGTIPGKGGDIKIATGYLSVSNTSQINASTFGNGNSGNIRIKTTGDIALQNNSQVTASTFGQGNAGDITINTGGKLSLEGTTVNGLNFDTGIFSIVGADSGLIGKGNGGNINVTSRDLSLNGAAISASNFVDENGGDININTGNIRLDNKSAIASVTNSGNGGNLNLNVTDYILLRRNSNISTTAGLTKSGGDGGKLLRS
jgi:filamentous hemagglutinin family protein